MRKSGNIHDLYIEYKVTLVTIEAHPDFKNEYLRSASRWEREQKRKQQISGT